MCCILLIYSINEYELLFTIAIVYIIHISQTCNFSEYNIVREKITIVLLFSH